MLSLFQKCRVGLTFKDQFKLLILNKMSVCIPPHSSPWLQLRALDTTHQARWGDSEQGGKAGREAGDLGNQRMIHSEFREFFPSCISQLWCWSSHDSETPLSSNQEPRPRKRETRTAAGKTEAELKQTQWQSGFHDTTLKMSMTESKITHYINNKENLTLNGKRQQQADRLKRLQQAIWYTLKTNEYWKFQQRDKKYKEKQNGNFRTETIIKISLYGLYRRMETTEERTGELEDIIEILQSEL